MKKNYISPEFDYAQFELSTRICASYYEGVIDDVYPSEIDGDEDV